jgi:ubiquitin carboxyl-terminal hydrolase 7
MRFQYDPQTDSNIKINDKYEFFEQIELDEYLDKKQSSPATYLLHAVLVHSGDNHGGHYVVFINPKLNGNWFKFDDEVVSRCLKKDAISANFGGTQSDDLTFRHSTNAYMLVYVRDSQKDIVLSDITKAEIPQALQDRLAEEKRLEALRKKERNEAHLYMQLNLFLEKEFYDNQGQAELYDSSKVESTKTLKIKKQSSLLEVMKQIGEGLDLPIEEIRLWSLMTRYNYTIRPYSCIDLKENANKNVVDVTKQETSWNVFVETSHDLSFSQTFDYINLMSIVNKQENSEFIEQQLDLIKEQRSQVPKQLPSYAPNEDVMIFFKYYDPKTSTLRYVFRMYISKKQTLSKSLKN